MSPSQHNTLLASASPRRRRLLAWLGIDYEITSVDTPEDLDSPLAEEPPALARFLAEEKARAAFDSSTPRLVLAFDTIVVLDANVLGKPVDIADARTMLGALSGRKHEVVTGVALIAAGEECPVSFSVTTPVSMRDLDDDSVESWIAEGELMGCAGAYNIERHLADVDLDQCFQNVAGLPLCHLYQELLRSGLAPSGMVSPSSHATGTAASRAGLGRP